MNRFLVNAPRWLLLFSLVWAPWAYGSTRDWTLPIFNWLLGSIALLWLVSLVVRRKRPVVHPVLLVCALFLIAQGWFMIWNAQYYYDRWNYRFVPIDCFWRAGPGVVDKVDAIPMMIRITGLLAAMCFVCDLARRPIWRTRIWWTIGLTGGSLMLFGVVREIMGVKLGSQYDAWNFGETSFATYYYHGNGAAFINLVLPAIAGLALIAFGKSGANFQRALWPAALLLCVTGAITAASKVGLIITGLLLGVLVAWHLTRIWKRGSASKPEIMYALIALLVCLTIAGIFGWERAKPELSRLPSLAGDETWQQRRLAAEVCLRMLPDTGAWGFGPANFAIAFPHYTNYLGNRIEGFWDLAHEDYLQTAIEWGWVGAAVWTIILFGGIGAGFRRYARRADELSRADRVLLFTSALSLLGVAMHAAVDFPLQIASLQLYVAVFTGILWGAGAWPKSRQRHTTGSTPFKSLTVRLPGEKAPESRNPLIQAIFSRACHALL